MSLLARLLGMLVAFVAVVAAAPAAAATWYVAGNGLDAPDCGTKRKPCRSITRALAQPTTVDGDRIIVGPGRYGDANDDGNLDDPGDEMPAPGCGCMLAVNKSVSVWSSNGAAATVIDAAGMPVRATVALFMNGGEFGRLGKGFTITSSADLSPIGISIDSGNIAVRGNQVIGYDRPFGTGIATVAFPQPMVLEGNLVSGWETGMQIRGGGAKRVLRNQAASNVTGIFVDDGDVIGNVAVGNRENGIRARGAGSVLGNAASGNRYGIFLETFTGRAEKNDLIGNVFCGIRGGPAPTDPALPLPDNYWGAETGPGVAPADPVCGNFDATKFAKRPHNVKPRFKL